MIDARLNQFEKDGVKVLISNRMFGPEGPWWTKLDFERDGVKVVVEAFGYTMSEAVGKAIARLDGLRAGITPRPMIEARPRAVPIDDEIPF